MHGLMCLEFRPINHSDFQLEIDEEKILVSVAQIETQIFDKTYSFTIQQLYRQLVEAQQEERRNPTGMDLEGGSQAQRSAEKMQAEDRSHANNG